MVRLVRRISKKGGEFFWTDDDYDCGDLNVDDVGFENSYLLLVAIDAQISMDVFLCQQQ